jgi:hypothetical protein
VRDGGGGAGDDLLGGAARLGGEPECLPDERGGGKGIRGAKADEGTGEPRLRPGGGDAADRGIQGAGIVGEAGLLDGVEPGQQVGAAARELRRRGPGPAGRGGEDGLGHCAGHRGDDRGGVGVRLGRQ